MTSVNTIKLTRPPVLATVSSDQNDNAAMFRGIRELMATCGPNKHDMVDVMINALIYQDVNTRSGIIGAGIRLGCKPGHVAILLKEGIGHRWWRDSDGVYHNLV